MTIVYDCLVTVEILFLFASSVARDIEVRNWRVSVFNNQLCETRLSGFQIGTYRVKHRSVRSEGRVHKVSVHILKKINEKRGKIKSLKFKKRKFFFVGVGYKYPVNESTRLIKKE